MPWSSRLRGSPTNFGEGSLQVERENVLKMSHMCIYTYLWLGEHASALMELWRKGTQCCQNLPYLMYMELNWWWFPLPHINACVWWTIISASIHTYWQSWSNCIQYAFQNAAMYYRWQFYHTSTCSALQLGIVQVVWILVTWEVQHCAASEEFLFLC